MSYSYTFPKEQLYQAVDFINNVKAGSFQVRASQVVYDLEGDAKEQTFMDLVDAVAKATHEIPLEVDWGMKKILINM